MVEVVYALHDFVPEHDDEVSFRAGDVIQVLEKDDQYGDGWWQGTNPQGASGLFPVSFTTYDKSAALGNKAAVESTAAACAAVDTHPEPTTEPQPVSAPASGPDAKSSTAVPQPAAGLPAATTASDAEPDKLPPGAFFSSEIDAPTQTAPVSSGPPIIPPISTELAPQNESARERDATQQLFPTDAGTDTSPSHTHSVTAEPIPEEPALKPSAAATGPQAHQLTRSSAELGASGTMADIDAVITHISGPPNTSNSQTSTASAGGGNTRAVSGAPAQNATSSHEPPSATRQETLSTAGDASGTDDEGDFGYSGLSGAPAARAALAANAQRNFQKAQEQKRLDEQRRTALALEQQEHDEKRLTRSGRGHTMSTSIDEPNEPSRLSTALDGLELSDESDLESDHMPSGFRSLNASANRPLDESSPHQAQPAYPPPTPPLFSNPVLPSVHGPAQQTALTPPPAGAVTAPNPTSSPPNVASARTFSPQTAATPAEQPKHLATQPAPVPFDTAPASTTNLPAAGPSPDRSEQQITQPKSAQEGLGLTSHGADLPPLNSQDDVPPAKPGYEPWSAASRHAAPPAAALGAQHYSQPPSSRHSASVRTTSIASSAQERDGPDTFGLGLPTSPASNSATAHNLASMNALSRSGTPATTAGSLAPSGDPADWSVAQVCQWARSKGWDEATVVSKFAEQEISGDVLLDLDINMLKEIDIQAFGVRHKIAVAIRDLRRSTATEGERAGSTTTGSYPSNPPSGYPSYQNYQYPIQGLMRGSSPANTGRPTSSIHSAERQAPSSPRQGQAHGYNPSLRYASPGPTGYAQPTPIVPPSSWGISPPIEQSPLPAPRSPPVATAPHARQSAATPASQHSGAPTVGNLGLGTKPQGLLSNPYDWSATTPSVRATPPPPQSTPGQPEMHPSETLPNPYEHVASPVDSNSAAPAAPAAPAAAVPVPPPGAETDEAVPKPSDPTQESISSPAAPIAGETRATTAAAHLGHKPTPSTELPSNLPEWARKEAQAEQEAAATGHERTVSGATGSSGPNGTSAGKGPTLPSSGSQSLSPSTASPSRPSNRRDDRTASSLFGLRAGRGDKSLSRFMSKRLGSGTSPSPTEGKPDLKSQISGPTNVLTSNAFASDPGSTPPPVPSSSVEAAAPVQPSQPYAPGNLSLQTSTVGGGPIPSVAPDSVMARIRPVDHEGWIKKKGERYLVWKPRYLAVKGADLVILRDPDATKIKGYIPLKGARVMSDESIHPGKYAFKIVHDPSSIGHGDGPAPAGTGERLVHYFSSDNPIVVRDWMKVLMKSSIARDIATPVVSSYQAKTISLAEAQAMNPPPRPPSPTSLVRTQKATVRDRTDQLTQFERSLNAIDRN